VGRVEYLNDPAAPRPNSLVPAAGVLAVDGQGRLLLQRRRDTGQWAIPMGKQEIGETVAECAVRETREETGVTVEVTGLLGIYSDRGHIVANTDGEVRQEYEVILTGRPVTGEPAANDEASAAGWFTVAELDGLDIHPMVPFSDHRPDGADPGRPALAQHLPGRDRAQLRLCALDEQPAYDSVVDIEERLVLDNAQAGTLHFGESPRA
jgi:8-oxo-dGTP pyrophosphatase MutT (NUDIX family)